MAYDANHRQVSEGYLKAIGTPLVRGRYFQTTDTERSMPVVIVNQTMARKYWPGGDPVGQRIAIDHGTWADPWLTVVGVVGDVRQMGLDAAAAGIPAVPADRHPAVVRAPRSRHTAGDPMQLGGGHQTDCSHRGSGAAGLEHPDARRSPDEDVASRRVGTTLLTAFAGFALVLAVVGIYGVIAYFVAQHMPGDGRPHRARRQRARHSSSWS
jgi:hypothetical protein